ncbi:MULTISPECIES: winged helix-turn-helix domain-containing protein [Microbulbifer]|uniref:winged helix-turn-helix domain-containing protein n=1 Tax=Microbulbifer TaxID=48073 RepID=UPI001CD7FFD0|nr:winged helix-turn-helix domain-containing protein [Microbulbifer agarilyticus]MCA0900256.1 winged helix-turn-helix domain-containing protein [Microbulbifer agarilyticus]
MFTQVHREELIDWVHMMRGQQPTSSAFRIGDYLYTPTHATITYDGDARRLEPQVNSLLKLLVDHAGHTVSRKTINTHIWADRVVGDDALRAMIRKLRDCLGDDARNPNYIRTVPLKGYALIAKVEKRPIKPPTSRARALWCVAGLATIALIGTLLLFIQPETTKKVEVSRLTLMPGSEVNPDYNPATNRLVFAHRANKDDFLQLYVKDLQTQQVQRLTWEKANYANAHWSPNGNQLAFTRSTAGNELDHFVADYDVDHGLINLQSISLPEGRKQYLSGWSYNGNALYFKSSPASSTPGITRLALEDYTLEHVTEPGNNGTFDFFARESKDGHKLVVLRSLNRDKQELLILDVATGALLHTRNLSQLYLRAAWSEDGRAVVLSGFTGELAKYLLDTDRFVTYSSVNGNTNHVFHHCGENCFFMRTHNGNYLDLQQQPLPFHDTALMATSQFSLPNAEDYPVIHPYGAGLYFLSRTEREQSLQFQSSQGESRAILELPPTATLQSLQVSPDGSQLTGLLDGRIFLLSVDDGQVNYFGNGVDTLGHPTWSRDGSSIYFSKLSSGTPTLYKAAPGGKPEPLHKNYIAMREVDKDSAIFIDADRLAWLHRSGDRPIQLVQLPDVSPNRWRTHNDWLYYTDRTGTDSEIHRVHLESGLREQRTLARNRFRLNFDLDSNARKIVVVKSLLAESDLVRVIAMPDTTKANMQNQ